MYRIHIYECVIIINSRPRSYNIYILIPQNAECATTTSKIIIKKGRSSYRIKNYKPYPIPYIAIQYTI